MLMKIDVKETDRKPAIDLYQLVREMFPINRSQTGSGVRKTLSIIAHHIDLEINEVPTGTSVFDWHVPMEWNIRGGSISTLGRKCLVDFASNNLHVLGYSRPVQGVFSRAELARHIHTLPDQPDLIPYRTGYHADDWGFCLSHHLWQTMNDDAYHVEINSDISPGSLTFGECFIPGETPNEVLLSSHICHPSLANDNLSGIAVMTALAMRQARQKRRLGYRFLFIPATIGAITWLARNEAVLANIKHGLVLTCLGDNGPFHYKQSRQGAMIDRAVAHVLRHSSLRHEIMPFAPYGYDERQFCSPAFNLPVGCLMRGVHGAFPEYHTSADNLDFVRPDALHQSYSLIETVLDLLDADCTYERVDGRCEPQLGRRGLYRTIAGQREAGGATQMDLLWLLNLADGDHGLLEMAVRADIPFARLESAARIALDAGLVHARPK
ncbi:aminopeptidase-like protein [Bradyrhizobium macuxiense]|uniref:Aminopeptidase-like protein n=2 Tax=Bradyrhizobium macuxiense TaxID=1755647 RepID=A0A560KVR9_9BRAD|nr:DUF4910 domain-containing protein [Bradyrhizobium macuxiense]TWB87305.1 aminopeptidase-like protein [Bradyrhizobium macuxiense]